MSEKIELTKGQYAIVDDEDYDYLNQWKWHAGESNGRFTARRTGKVEEKRKLFLLHRVIMNCPKDKVVDHINHNTLDNRKENLRICTQQQNVYNSRNIRDKLYSKHKGVSFNKSVNKYIAQIRVKKTLVHLGCFHKELDAAETYKEAAKTLHGEFACVNG